MFDKEENVELDGHTLFLDFAAKRTSMGYAGWEKDLELDESSKNSPVHMKCDIYNYQMYEYSVPSAESFFLQWCLSKFKIRLRKFGTLPL